MGKDTTKLALLKTGARFLKEKGYNHTGIQEVLQATGVPKGSFYYYFKSKEDFGLEIVKHDACEHNQVLDKYLKDETLSPLTRLRQYFAAKCEEFASLQCREGCLLGNLGQELADQNERFRLRLEEIFAAWRDRYIDCLQQAQAVGEISPDLDVRILADFCLNSWEGALQQMKVTKSPVPLQTFMSVMFDVVLKP
ncbi:TetR family transcriptional regulator C-terminal domain-containing protein [Gloeocapsopsis crepidinum LEGE 06123]|uniref:TetR family transcriptional regulator C-terminal domain-containing protein n=1 Tax=Gloeocapsopsis crepidinum LEGE 06123 TaxID=588587 RepID=A0ABR9V0D0_9CHRO|nr:TetR/AcrR family transcriptional regulator [Gloeocapsopsis crepidinum]MBE9192968.1 TetR family transcriptional regulator C-terminal domain-containing protein [Gloeocapsopsis crepidinum LEGE 06123]